MNGYTIQKLRPLQQKKNIFKTRRKLDFERSRLVFTYRTVSSKNKLLLLHLEIRLKPIFAFFSFTLNFPLLTHWYTIQKLRHL